MAWIPKAEGGDNPDNWRPLGLPSSFLRLLAAGIYRHIARELPKILHPSQALLNSFREPQANFSDVQQALHSKPGTKGDLTAVLLTDFVKAFEMINPNWIMEVLRARNAPTWLIAYVKFVLFKRKVTP